MKKVLTLSKEQVRLLHNLLSGSIIKNRSDNRKRFKFLDVIEDAVFKFEDQLEGIETITGKTTPKEVRRISDEVKELGKKTKKFTFKDREIFAYGKDLFEKSFEKGNKVRDPMGKTTESPLTGYNARVYTEIEDAFMDVREIRKNGKKTKA